MRLYELDVLHREVHGRSARKQLTIDGVPVFEFHCNWLVGGQREVHKKSHKLHACMNVCDAVVVEVDKTTL